MPARAALVALSGALLVAGCGASTRVHRPVTPAATPSAMPAPPSPTPSAMPAGTAAPPMENASPRPVTPAPSARPPAEGVLLGTTLIAPTCPVERPGVTCTAPVAAAITIVDSLGRRVASTVSGADGVFRISLPPGTYTVVASLSGTRPMTRSAVVQISPGATPHVSLTFDSGIR